jgi:hypothetical protein
MELARAGLVKLEIQGRFGFKVAKVGSNENLAILQGGRGGVTKILQETVLPHMHGVHCISHRTNLAVKELSNLPVIAKIKNLLQSLYSYFACSPKRHLEFTKLAAVMETKGLKIIRNIKTR